MKTNSFFFSHSTLLILLLAGMPPRAEAQNFVIGARVMPVIANMQLQSESGYAIKGRADAGVGAAGFVGYQFSPLFGIQAEIQVSSFGLKYEEQGVTRKVNLQYVQIPVLLALNTGRNRLVNLNIVAGPQVGVNTGSSLRISGADSNTPVAILGVRKGDLGLAYGGGLDVGVNRDRTVRLGVGYRGAMGILNIGKSNASLAPDTFLIANKTRVRTHAIYLEAAFAF